MEQPFEICHCTRCRKVSGSAGMAGVTVATNHFRLVSGRELIKSHTAPILYRPPAYQTYFCSECGSPVPAPDPEGDLMEIPAGLFDGDLGIEPDKHIFVDLAPDWDPIGGGPPALYRSRDRGSAHWPSFAERLRAQAPRLVRLFHFSDDPNIESFVPRPTDPPKPRGPGKSWLNDPLVWAIEEWHLPMYLFPRNCPRILLWQTAGSTADDIEAFLGASPPRMVAYLEEHRVAELAAAKLFRYELPAHTFIDLDDAGMWVSKATVKPLCRAVVENLPRALGERGVELRVVPSLVPLRGLWQTSLHASGIRLSNARGWESA